MSTASQHPVDYLFERLADWTYPTGVVPVPQKKIPGTAFFPGGCGLWRERPGADLPPMPLGKVMVLGQDFNNEKGYSEALQVGHELDIPTWRGSGRGRGLLGLLRDANISPTDCFFTNAYMGLRPDESSNKGPFPGRTDKEFVERCQSFLQKQIAVQQPRLLLVLGLEVVKFIAPLSLQLEAWRDAGNWRSVDDAGPVKHQVRFGDGATRMIVVTLLHPSYRELNLAKHKLRSYRGRTEDEAELTMLRESATALF